MPVCYLLVVCEHSLIDAQTNNWTLVSLVERIKLEEPLRPAGVPVVGLQAHTYWMFEDAEFGTPFEVKINIELGARTESLGPYALTSTTRTHRLRFVGGLPIVGAGEQVVSASWRVKGETEWQDAGLRWPFMCELGAGAQKSEPKE